MIPPACKRLAEVDFPISAVSKHAAREKSIRHGHPSTLHLWWARRPLASSRAVLLALLLPDPCDPYCPEDFRRVAVRQIRGLAAYLVDTKAGAALLVADLKSDLRSKKQGTRESAEREAGRRARIWNDLASDAERWPRTRVRSGLLHLLAQGAAWEWSSAEPFVNVCRTLVKAAHGEETPLVVDPFAGGGSIPLEALRLGCEAFASDLNPVACLILKVMLEDIPRHGPGLADELRKVGAEIKAAAEEELADLYPPDPDGATPIAYLWARTVRCEAPNCGAEIPLMRSPWLCKKARRKRALRPRVVRGEDLPPRVEFELFEPAADKDVRAGTVARAQAACVCCGSVLPPDRVRAQLAAQRGGADVIFDEQGRRVGGAFLLAVVTLRPGEKGRHYRLPTERDYGAVHQAQERVTRILAEWERGGFHVYSPVPDEPLPPIGTLGFRVQRYGMLKWGDLFTARQKAALSSVAAVISGARDLHHGNAGLLALALGKAADLNNSGAPWKPDAECPVHMLSSQKIPPFWDWAETVLCAESSGSFHSAVNRSAAALNAAFSFHYQAGDVHTADAASPGLLPDRSVSVWFTDPPYYDAVPYADLSDFFLVWLKRTLRGQSRLQDRFDSANPLSPKAREAVQDETKHHDGRPKDRTWFEETMARAFAEGRRVLHEDGVGSVVFAHKTTEGWEALLSGMIRGGWTITGSWPIATEMGSRLRARDSAALATSVHLICRPRPDNADVGDWADVLRDLPKRVGDWMERLQSEGVRGADLVFACIGPALEIFSRYARVETADGGEVGLPAYLEKVWEVVGRTALENILGAAEAQARNGLAGALEEDARLTALFLWTLQATTNEDTQESGDTDGVPTDDPDDQEAPGGGQGYSLVFDVVRRFAQPLGIDLPKWERRTIETTKGIVRLLPVAERARQLFGEKGSQAVATWLERESADETDPLQGVLFPNREEQEAHLLRERRPPYGDDDMLDDRSGGATTLDRIHTGMLLQAGGLTNALRALLRAERERGPDFLRLSNALSALYPRGSEEKRLLDAMLLVVPK